jgi:predicted ArsR family transcriptional regulator
LFLLPAYEKIAAVPQGDLTTPDPPEALALGKSRARVLEMLQTEDRPFNVEEVAKRLRLHANTARFHLDGLVEQNLVQRTSEERETPGRPRMLYSAAPDAARAGQRSYRLLAEILTSYLASATRQPEQAALKAGEEWGRYLTERPAPFRRVDASSAIRQLVEVLDEIGFAPETVVAGRKRQIELHHCPFREAADRHRDVVCSIHLGLMRGLLAELDAPIDAVQLDPLVRPDLCITHLSARRPAR